MSTRAVNMERNDYYDIKIDRSTKWGNPYQMDVMTQRERDHINDEFENNYFWKTDLPADLHELIGRRLGCTCKPHRCHGDFLSIEANQLAKYLTRRPGLKKTVVISTDDKVKLYWMNDKGNPEVRIGFITNIDNESFEEPVIEFEYETFKGVEQHVIAFNSILGMEVL